MSALTLRTGRRSFVRSGDINVKKALVSFPGLAGPSHTLLGSRDLLWRHPNLGYMLVGRSSRFYGPSCACTDVLWELAKNLPGTLVRAGVASTVAPSGQVPPDSAVWSADGSPAVCWES